jgi:UDP-N-acetylglucosamine diphosphorylase/glucosamine-1-phosphate N-acetyltransferase
MQPIFTQPAQVDSLYPFSATRPVEDIRVGIMTIREKWQHLLPALQQEAGGVPVLPAWIIPDRNNALALLRGDWNGNHLKLETPIDIFTHNQAALSADFALLTEGRKSEVPHESNSCISPGNIFIEEGAKVRHSILNAEQGPIYIGRNAEVMEGCLIRGPFALCESAVLKMGARVYGAATIGPYCIAGGEIKNSVMMGYSNKAHDGYLGDSVVGEWCNLGAGTTNSNMKNTVSPVRVWDKSAMDYIPRGLKCGLLMGDYSRSAINTAFNTGTMVGVCCHVFGDAKPPKLVADFSWGNERYGWHQAMKDIRAWKALKRHELTGDEEETLKRIYHQ